MPQLAIINEETNHSKTSQIMGNHKMKKYPGRVLMAADRCADLLSEAFPAPTRGSKDPTSVGARRRALINMTEEQVRKFASEALHILENRWPG